MYVYTHIYIMMYTQSYIHICVLLSLSLYICIYIERETYTHMYTCTHTYLERAPWFIGASAETAAASLLARVFSVCVKQQ